MLAMDTEREKYTAASRKTAAPLSDESQKAFQYSAERFLDHGPRTAGAKLKRVIIHVKASRIASIK